MSESMLQPEERNKETSQGHGEDQQERKAWEIIHIYSRSCRNKTGLTFYKRSSDCEHSKKRYLHITGKKEEKKKGNSRNTVPLSQVAQYQKSRCYECHLTESTTPLPRYTLLEGHNRPQLSMKHLRGGKLRLAKSLIVYRETDTETNYPSANKGMAPRHTSGTLAAAAPACKTAQKMLQCIYHGKKILHGGKYHSAAEMLWVSSGNTLYIRDWCFPPAVFPCVSKLRQENTVSL